MEREKNEGKASGPVVFIIEPTEGETHSPETHGPMTAEEVSESLKGFEEFETVGMVDELMPDLGERGFGAFKYNPVTGRLTQDDAIVSVRLGDNGSEQDLRSLLHWVEYQGTGRMEDHLATIGIDPGSSVLTLNVKDKITVRIPLVLLIAMISEHERLERIRLGRSR